MAEQLTFFKIKNTQSEDKKIKRNWENNFQAWSDKQNENSAVSSGKCGYGVMCDCCANVQIGRPCVRALNAYCRENFLTIDYKNAPFIKVWNGEYFEEKAR